MPYVSSCIELLVPSFPPQEYRTRVASTRARMEERDLELLWVTSPANMNYLSGYDAWSFYVHQGLLVSVHEPEPLWVGRGIDVPCVRQTTFLDSERIHAYGDEYLVPPAHAMTFVAEVIRARGWDRARIGVEMDTHYFTALAYSTLRRSLPQCRFADADRLVNWIRTVKSASEIQYMVEAGQLTDAAMRAAIDSIAPGVRHCDVAALVYGKLINGVAEFCGDVPDYQTMPKGRATAAPHVTWTAEPYQAGEACTLELGGNRCRYHAPLARTVFLGKPPPKLLSLSAIVGDGLASALSAVRPGVTCESVESAWRTSVSRSGIVKESRIGYCVGLGYPPDWGERTASLMPGDRTELLPNMTFHLMLGIWDAEGGYEISETFRVSDSGHECLSKLPRRLFIRDA